MTEDDETAALLLLVLWRIRAAVLGESPMRPDGDRGGER